MTASQALVPFSPTIPPFRAAYAPDDAQLIRRLLAEARFTPEAEARIDADAPRLVAIDRIRHEAERIAERRGLGFELHRHIDVPTCPMDETLQGAFARSVASLGLDVRRLPSGAGHDAMAMARAFPAAMLFVRSKDGISHNPKEWSSPEDIGLGVEALTRTILDLAERHGDGTS